MQKSTEKYKLCLYCKYMNCKNETIKKNPTHVNNILKDME